MKFPYSSTILAFVLLFHTITNCLSQDTNQMVSKDWKGRFLDSGESIALADLPHSVVALNVYAPNCIPCWKEIDVLNRIQTRLSKDANFGIYMIVDPKLVSESVDGFTDGDDFVKFATEVMKREKRERNIQLNIIIMEPPFRVSNSSFVTGTPETILVRTNPWNIYYNFIGAISDEKEILKIDNDPKVKFFFSSLGARGL
ncbi:MAG: TlpA family protein disulfide reductase [Leptospira sp.]|nr:TlpA family protein disulfide reductase [Leptospira sp.]